MSEVCKQSVIELSSDERLKQVYNKKAEAINYLADESTKNGEDDTNVIRAVRDIEEYEEFVYGAILLDRDDPVAEWRAISQKQDEICRYLESKKSLHVISKDTDLRMSIEGRKWINCDCKMNVPDGEVFTTPIENSVEGYIRFSYPGIFNGKEIEDIKLEFKEGKVVKATAAKGEDLLSALLDIDAGARTLGEFAIGTNYGIQKFTKNMLFDEKIGGTIHAAIGAVPAETGGTNQSGIHWDMLCNMSDGGEIYADGELIYKDGKFINWSL
jgi:aminopeptidase